MTLRSPNLHPPLRGGEVALVLLLAGVIWLGEAAFDLLVLQGATGLADAVLRPDTHHLAIRLVLILSTGVASILVRRFQAQRDRTADLLDSLEHEIALLDEQGRIVGVNEAWTRFGPRSGEGPRGVGGRSYLDVVMGTSRADAGPAAERLAEGLHRVLEGTIPEATVELPTGAPGARRWLRVSVRPFRDQGRRGALVSHTDITAQMAARAASREQGTRFRRAVDLAPFPVMLHAEDGEVLRINEAWTELTGYDPSDLPTMEAWIERASGEQRDFLRHFVGRLEDGETRRKDGEFIVRTKEGDERIWDFSSVALGTLEDGRRIVLSMAADVTGRASAEARAARARDEIRAIFDASPTPIVTLDGQGRVRSWNPAAEELFGWTEEETVGRTPPFVPADREEEFQRLLSRVLSGETVRGLETVRQAKDGRPVTVGLSAGPIVDGDGGVVGLAHITSDITARKQAEDQLIRLNRSLRMLSASNRAVARQSEPRELMDEVCRIAVEVGGHQAAWIGLRARGTDELGVAAADGQGARAEGSAGTAGGVGPRSPVWDAGGARPAVDMPAACAARVAVETGETCVVEDPARDPRCSCGSDDPAESHSPAVAMPLTLDGRVAGVLTIVFSDPSLLDESELAVLDEVGRDLAHGLMVASTFQELRLLRSAIEALDLGISIADARRPERPLVFANEALTEMTGYAREELLGRPFHFLSASKEDAELGELDELIRAMSTGELTQVALGLRRKSGERYWNRVTLDAIQDGDGNLTHLVAVEEDVTERRRMGLELEHRERLSALGQLAGGVAHDIRNLLTAIGGLVDLALMDEAQGEGSGANLREIKSLLPRSRSVLDRLLAFSRREDLDARPVDLTEALRDGVDLLRSVLRDDIEVSTELGESAWVRIDPGQFQQLVFNVAMNAQHAMPEGGTFSIRARTEASGVRLPPRNGWGARELTDRWIWVSMEDTGLGMDAEVRVRAFEPFFTTKGTGQGTGLGLSSCYGLISGSGGRIWLDSEPGEGTTLHFILPRIPAPEPRAEGDSTAGRGIPTPARATTVLLAEDEAAIRRTFQRFLEGEGHRVLSAGDGRAALELFEEAPDDVGILVTDAMMPRMSGIELSRRVLERRPDLPVLLISGYVSRELPELPREGRIHLLHKPFDLAELREAVARMTTSRRDREAAVGDTQGGEDAAPH